jgi:hypothetical protein
MKRRTWLFILMMGSLLLLSGITHAEGECPPGMFPTNPSGTQGPVGCAPIPGYEQQQGQQQTRQAPPPQWASRWGAIATDAIKGILGTSTDVASKDEAEQRALTECQTKGGMQCKLQNSYSNACVAMITGSKIFNVGSDADLNRAVQSGMKKCTAADTNCHVYYSACSLPQRLQ